ncbi:AraC family transcriptional regulator [Roseburia hominis]
MKSQGNNVEHQGLKHNLDIGYTSRTTVCTPHGMLGDFPFVLLHWGYYSANKGFFVDFWNTDGYMLILSLSGKGVMTYKERKFEIAPYDLLVIDYKQKHLYGTAPNCQKWEYIYVKFKGASAAVYDKLINGREVAIINVKNARDICARIYGMEIYARDMNVNSGMCFSNDMIYILNYMVMHSAKYEQEVGKIENENIRRAVEYIHKHYQEKITLEKLSEISYLSKYHFTRVFKQIMGVAPYEYVICVRVNKVKELLTEGTREKSIQTIASATGFGNGKNLTRTFKKITGMTPEQYRDV